MPVVLVPILLKLKAWAISALLGFAMRSVLNQVKVSAPGLWEKVPEALRPYLSTALGTLAAVGAGDPANLVIDAIGGASGGVVAKQTYEAKKAAEPPCAPPPTSKTALQD